MVDSYTLIYWPMTKNCQLPPIGKSDILEIIQIGKYPVGI